MGRSDENYNDQNSFKGSDSHLREIEISGFDTFIRNWKLMRIAMSLLSTGILSMTGSNYPSKISWTAKFLSKSSDVLNYSIPIKSKTSKQTRDQTYLQYHSLFVIFHVKVVIPS